MTFDDLRVDPLLFPVAEVRLDGEDHLGPREVDAFLEVGRGRCVRDADDAAARENDSQVDRDRFRSHRQVQRDSVAPFRPRRFEAVCDPGRQATQVAVAHPADLLAPFGRVDDRQFLRIRTETALCDVEARTGEPIRMRDVGLRIEDARRAFLEDDAEALDHRGPEVLTVSGGPSLQLVVGADVPIAHERGHIRSANRFAGGHPNGSGSRFFRPIFVGELVQGRMDGERSAKDWIRLGEGAKLEPETDLRLRIPITARPLEDGGEPLRCGPRGIRGQPHLFEIGRLQGTSHGRECRRRFLSLRR